MKISLSTIPFLISFTVLSSHSWALPPCPSSGYFHNCYGSHVYKDGNKYVGEWKNDFSHGTGNKTYYNGDKYLGQWKNGKKHGQGTYIFSNGSKDTGEFKNDKLNGFAIRYDKYGNMLKEGIWKDDKFLYTQKKPIPNSNSKLDKYKSFCSEIGFTPGTEKFGECVLEAMKKG